MRPLDRSTDGDVVRYAVESQLAASGVEAAYEERRSVTQRDPRWRIDREPGEDRHADDQLPVAALETGLAGSDGLEARGVPATGRTTPRPDSSFEQGAKKNVGSPFHPRATSCSDCRPL